MAQQTFGDLVDAAFRALGKADAGESRDPVLQDLLELYAYDLPGLAGGVYARGLVELDCTGTPTDGAYDFPATMAAPLAVTRVVTDGGGESQWNGCLVTDAESFFYDWPLGGTGGPPTAILIHGRQIHVRPVPTVGVWTGSLFFESTVFWSTASFTEATVVPRQELVPALRAAATMLAAQTLRQFENAAAWSKIYEARAQRPRQVNLAQVHGTVNFAQPDF